MNTNDLSVQNENSCTDTVLAGCDWIVRLEYWRERWLFNDWKLALRYYLMVFFWLVLIIGFSGIVGFYTETMAFYWLYISISMIAISMIYLPWYFYIDWRVAPDFCCAC